MNLLFWWGTAWRYLWRSRHSTGTLAVMIFSAVAMLIFLDAVAVGVNDAMIRNSVSLFSGHISADHLPMDLSPEQLHVTGVRHVLQRRSNQIWISAHARLAPVLLFEVQPEAEKAATALWKKTIQGRYPQAGTREIFLGAAVATELGVQVGDKIGSGSKPGFSSQEYELAGIYTTGIAALDQNLAFCPLSENMNGADWSAAIFLEDGISPEDVITAYRAISGNSTFTAWTERMPDLKQLIDLNSLCMLLIMILVFFVVSLGIACAFVIFILKNIREHGIMKSMGVRACETAQLLFLEITGLTVSASLLGVLVGCILSVIVAKVGLDLGAMTSHNQYFAVSGIIYPRLTWSGLVIPPLLALLFALFAGIWPAWMVVRKRPAEVLRSL